MPCVGINEVYNYLRVKRPDMRSDTRVYAGSVAKGIMCLRGVNWNALPKLYQEVIRVEVSRHVESYKSLLCEGCSSDNSDSECVVPVSKRQKSANV